VRLYGVLKERFKQAVEESFALARARHLWRGTSALQSAVDYDASLYKIAIETMSYEGHVDWCYEVYK